MVVEKSVELDRCELMGGDVCLGDHCVAVHRRDRCVEDVRAEQGIDSFAGMVFFKEDFFTGDRCDLAHGIALGEIVDKFAWIFVIVKNAVAFAEMYDRKGC